MDKDVGLRPNDMGEYSYQECASRDIEVLQTCDAIYMMSNWQFSKGACWERALAKHWGIARYYEVPRADHETTKLKSLATDKDKDWVIRSRTFVEQQSVAQMSCDVIGNMGGFEPPLLGSNPSGTVIYD